jgi:hypothetical protein
MNRSLESESSPRKPRPPRRASVQEEEFFEYQIYTLQRPATIKNNQTKQISLVSADQVPVRKRLVYFRST